MCSIKYTHNSAAHIEGIVEKAEDYLYSNAKNYSSDNALLLTRR